jgi:hypothetical protein
MMTVSHTTPNHTSFDEEAVIHHLKHYLPAQAPLKDFIHHNTLHAFQGMKFFDAIHQASVVFGYKVTLSLEEYRNLYTEGKISAVNLQRTLIENKGQDQLEVWKEKMLTKNYQSSSMARIGKLRYKWQSLYGIDLDALVQPTLFRILCSYLDQGISIWSFPGAEMSFLDALRNLEQNSFSSFFQTKRVRALFLNNQHSIKDLLKMLVGDDESLYTHYLFDQQFAHQGWSGMVSAIEDQPSTLLDTRRITLKDLITFELFLEIDAIENHIGKNWKPLQSIAKQVPGDLFDKVPSTELDQVIKMWQETFEWSYYDQVLKGIQLEKSNVENNDEKSFQAMFCIDDRECSLRRYLEQNDPRCETYGTPGFFGVEFYYQPEHGKFYTKVCPAPVNPNYLIKEKNTSTKQEKDAHFSKHSHSFHSAWLISQTLGFWSVLKLFVNIFRPSMSPATATSLKHMDRNSVLSIENKDDSETENGLQIGFKVPEMVTRVEGLLKSIGLVGNFAPLVYVVGHGASSVNNPHYAAYDCGACSGRAGSVNARVISSMANHPEVRALLREKGIDIPETTRFIGGLHDTTRDEIVFYDDDKISQGLKDRHKTNVAIFEKALFLNAKERSRRFASIDSHQSPEKIHDQIVLRSVSLFEPRPELNHATNALCIVGRRYLSKGIFLDRRSFLNSYDYRVDPDGKYLFNILKAAAPVCGGINLEYYFSRVDNQRLGAGSKLPHNVMGLFGVANGIDGDLRPGLPKQMIEIHDPVRLLMIVEHFPEVVLNTIQILPATYEWFINDWVKLVVVHPETRACYRFVNGDLLPYEPTLASIPSVNNLNALLESSEENFPVYLIQQS